MAQERRSEKISDNPSMKIWRAGRRRTDNTLLPLGYFSHVLGGDMRLTAYKQELDTKHAVVTTDCTYSNSSKIFTTAAVHHEYPLIMVHRKIQCAEPFRYRFEYHLDAAGDDVFAKAENSRRGIDISYLMLNKQRGVICVFADAEVKREISGSTYSLTCAVPAGETEVTFYMLFCDSIDGDQHRMVAEQYKEYVLKTGYDRLLEEHTEKWLAYYDEGFAVTDDPEINQVYDTAQYHLKCNTTQWSIPVGIFDNLWEGRFFAFDEAYMVLPLLSSNHINAAYRTPHFRAQGLKQALHRAGGQKARYPWETLEDGSEGSKSGFWHDHVSHMACVALTEYHYYLYTQDKRFLQEEGYPVIRACALFYIHHMLYEAANGYLKVAKCTDLEHLGSSVPNGYLTMCGIIKTIDIFCETAKILGLEDAARYEGLADRLIASLPNDGKKYVPYDGCTGTSAGLMSGTFPFDVIDRENILQKNGIAAYIADETENLRGTMYIYVSGICPWYYTWKAVVFGRLGKTKEAYQALKNAVRTTGNFSELYEINNYETEIIYRPWFATAAGTFIQAVNEMLVRYENGLIYIGASLPGKIHDFSCRLAVPTGIVVDVTVQNNCLTALSLTSSQNIRTADVAISDRLSLGEPYSGNVVKSIDAYQVISCEVKEKKV